VKNVRGMPREVIGSAGSILKPTALPTSLKGHVKTTTWFFNGIDFVLIFRFDGNWLP
jgi:hypothetical protein